MWMLVVSHSRQLTSKKNNHILQTFEENFQRKKTSPNGLEGSTVGFAATSEQICHTRSQQRPWRILNSFCTSTSGRIRSG